MQDEHPGKTEETQRLTSEQLAGLIVDALVDAGLVPKSEFNSAVAVAAEEIDARKAVGDY